MCEQTCQELAYKHLVLTRSPQSSQVTHKFMIADPQLGAKLKYKIGDGFRAPMPRISMSGWILSPSWPEAERAKYSFQL